MRLGARRHGCYTFVCFMIALVAVIAMAGCATVTAAFGPWGALELIIPVGLVAARHRITTALFRFTIRNQHGGDGGDR